MRRGRNSWYTLVENIGRDCQNCTVTPYSGLRLWVFLDSYGYLHPCASKLSIGASSGPTNYRSYDNLLDIASSKTNGASMTYTYDG